MYMSLSIYEWEERYINRVVLITRVSYMEAAKILTSSNPIIKYESKPEDVADAEISLRD